MQNYGWPMVIVLLIATAVAVPLERKQIARIASTGDLARLKRVRGFHNRVWFVIIFAVLAGMGLFDRAPSAMSWPDMMLWSMFQLNAVLCVNPDIIESGEEIMTRHRKSGGDAEW